MQNTIFEAIRKYGHDEDYEPLSECLPTAARPGSIEKIDILAKRLEAGQELWHEGDQCMACIVSESHTALWIRSMNGGRKR